MNLIVFVHDWNQENQEDQEDVEKMKNSIEKFYSCYCIDLIYENKLQETWLI